MNRREWISAGVLSGLAWTSVGRHAMAATDLEIGSGRGTAAGAEPLRGAGWDKPSDARARRLVVVFLRGAVDGLSVVVPYHDDAYYAARSTIALARPGNDNGVLDLDGRFGLHPALSPLLPWWRSGRLGFVHASGSPDPTRSHFDAQDYMESATPGRKSTADGWMNRLLGRIPGNADEQRVPIRAVSIGAVMPRIYAGSNAVANLPSGAAATRASVLDRPQVGQAFAQMYSGDDPLSQAFQASRSASREVHESLARADVSMGDSRSDGQTAADREMREANNGAALPNGFPDDAARLAKLMRNDSRVRLAFLALGGWDTHANQGGATGQLANRLSPLGRGLAEFAARMGPALDDTVVVVMSEFGRTFRQNGNAGTDHGHGNAMWLLGGPVQGGKVHGRWPGLDAGALHEGRDLAVTTDFRSVLAQICERHLRLPDTRLAELFPGFDGTAGDRLALLRA